MKAVNLRPARLRDPAEVRALAPIMRDFYAHKPREYDLHNRPQGSYDAYASLLEAYVRPGAAILDFGAGTARSPITLARRGFEVTACDVFSDQELYDYARQTGELPVHFATYDGENLPFADAHFDAVASSCVLEHIICVEHCLRELHRVLKPGGLFVIVGPNWSGLNNPVRALLRQTRGERYWQYETPLDAVLGIVRVFCWYAEVRMAREPRFLLVRPRMRDGKIAFEASDDDCVHLCQPLSFRRWFERESYDLLKYNRGEGATKLARVANAVLPSLSTTNVIVARKPLAMP
jgi:SAM-dependent methyltransferase